MRSSYSLIPNLELIFNQNFRTIFENHFSQYTEQEQVYNFVSPKVKRLIDILLSYKPSKPPEPEVTEEKAPSTSNEEVEGAEESKTEEIANPETPSLTSLTICDSYIRYKSEKANRWKNRRKFPPKKLHIRVRVPLEESETVCSVIFVKSRLVASIIHYLLSVSGGNYFDLFEIAFISLRLSLIENFIYCSKIGKFK